jgi:hypothetical protein
MKNGPGSFCYFIFLDKKAFLRKLNGSISFEIERFFSMKNGAHFKKKKICPHKERMKDKERFKLVISSLYKT